MKTTPRKQRCDSAAAAVRAAQGVALGPLNPPDHVTLRPGDRPFWDAVILSRARDTWNDSDLAIAANLARSQADIEKLQAELDIDGYSDEKGRLSVKAAAVEMLTKRTIALSRILHVHAAATLGDSEEAHKALAVDKKARAAAPGSDLIPTLRAV